MIKKIFAGFADFFSDSEDLESPGYEPAHIVSVLVITLFAMTVLFWLLWSLLVFGGGIQAKVLPAISVLFGGKSVKDFGYIGYPYEMGVFEGWVTNVAALLFSILILTGIWYIFEKKDVRKGTK